MPNRILDNFWKGAQIIDKIYDTILWYAKDKEQVKSKKLYVERGEHLLGQGQYDFVLNKNHELISRNDIKDNDMPVSDRVLILTRQVKAKQIQEGSQ